LAVWFSAAYLLASPPRLGREEQPLTCTFVAVGHGTAAILRMPDGRTMLYDAGHMGSPLGATRPVSEILWSRGVTHLDAVIISHADSDHFNGLPELLHRFSVGRVCVSPVMFERSQPAAEELRRSLMATGITFDPLSAGDRLRFGRATVEVLHPPRKGVIGSDNANSIVLLVEYEGRRLLLPGDLEPPGLEDLMAEEPLDCDVVMAPHHGSRRSDPTGFALWSSPDFVVISGSRDVEDEPEIASVEFSYGARGGQVFHTAKHGAVDFELSAAGVRASSFRPREDDR
jgi:competence protein ComEC